MVSRGDGYYKKLYESMTFLEDRKSTIEYYRLRVSRGKERYELASEYVKSKTGRKIPWQVIGVIHSLEASCDFNKQILNGQNYRYKTTIVPRGQGPWETWEDACVTAFKNPRWESVDFKDPESLLSKLESFNGWGYRNRSVNSPYLWSFSNHGVGTGKYVSDGRYSSSAVSKQCGCAVILKSLEYSFTD